MKKNKRMRRIALLFLSTFLLCSCSNDQGNSSPETTISLKQTISKTNKDRTEDMLIFKAKLNEISQMQQKKTDRIQVQENLLLASQEFLKANNEKIESNTSKTQIISKAFALYSEKSKLLNSTKK